MTTQEKIDALTAFIDTVRGLMIEAAIAGHWREARMHSNDLANLIHRRAVLRHRLRAEQAVAEPPTL